MDNIWEVPESLRIIGLRQAKKAIVGKKLRCVFFAEDIDEEIKRQVSTLCKENGIPCSSYRSRAEMGERLGIDVPCAVCGILQTNEQEQS